MLCGEYIFHMRLEEDAVLPPFKGGVFRRLLEKALKQVVCVLKHQTCDRCPIVSGCLYGRLFECAQEGASRGQPAPPFALRPPTNIETRLPAGGGLDFGLTLFGETNRDLAYFVYAVEQAGKTGIGRRVGRQRAPYRLLSVSENGRMIYEDVHRQLVRPALKPIELEEPCAGRMNRLTLRLLTPLRLLHRNRVQRALPFRDLVDSSLRRVRQLNAFREGSGSLPALRQLKEDSAEIRTVRERLRWVDWKYYSSKQAQTVFMGGIVGEVTYEGMMGPFMPLLRVVERTGLGKGTAFGMGVLQLITETDESDGTPVGVMTA